MKQIEKLEWEPRWVTHLGCLMGCLDCLEIDVTCGWLFGGTGHAFMLNIHEELCPSGPTAWKAGVIHKLGKNIGYEVEGIVGFKSREDFSVLQKRAWDTVRKAIDEGIPCFGWELDIPEYYAIYGYDDVGYHFKGPMCDNGKGPLSWEKLGDTGIGVVEVYAVRPGAKAEDAKTVREALQFALEAADGADQYVHENYSGGLSGYETWISALEAGKAGGFGMAYNAAVWAECRQSAASFLREAQVKLDDGLATLFDEGIAHYDVVSQELTTVSETFPFLNTSEEEKQAHIQDLDRRKKAANALKTAREAEVKGLKVLEQIVAQLG